MKNLFLNQGQEEEMAVYKRSNTKTIYLNVAINAIKRLRNEIAESLPSTSKKPKMNAMKLSHEAILGGKNATKISYTIKRSGNSTKIVENFKGNFIFMYGFDYIVLYVVFCLWQYIPHSLTWVFIQKFSLFKYNIKHNDS